MIHAFQSICFYTDPIPTKLTIEYFIFSTQGETVIHLKSTFLDTDIHNIYVFEGKIVIDGFTYVEPQSIHGSYYDIAKKFLNCSYYKID